MNHYEIDGNIYKDKKSEWLDYVKRDVLCAAFSYARYSKPMEQIKGFSMKEYFSLPGPGWKNFNSLRTKKEAPIYTYKYKYMRWFVRQNIKGGRVCAFNQNYKSKTNCDDIIKLVSEELNVEGKKYDINDAYFNYKDKHFKIIEKEYENQFNDYRDEDVEEKGKFIDEKLSQFPIHQFIKQIKLDDLLWDYDANSLYPSAMWDEKSIYPRIRTGYAFTKGMNGELVETYKTQTFNQGSVFLEIRYYNPENLIIQHIPVKERVNKIEVNR